MQKIQNTNYTLATVVTVGSGALAVISAVALAAIAFYSLEHAYLIGAGISTALFTSLFFIGSIARASYKKESTDVLAFPRAESITPLGVTHSSLNLANEIQENGGLENCTSGNQREAEEEEEGNRELEDRWGLYHEIDLFAMKVKKEDFGAFFVLMNKVFSTNLIYEEKENTYELTLDEIQAEFDKLKLESIKASPENMDSRLEMREPLFSSKSSEDQDINARDVFRSEVIDYYEIADWEFIPSLSHLIEISRSAPSLTKLRSRFEAIKKRAIKNSASIIVEGSIVSPSSMTKINNEDREARRKIWSEIRQFFLKIKKEEQVPFDNLKRKIFTTLDVVEEHQEFSVYPYTLEQIQIEFDLLKEDATPLNFNEQDERARLKLHEEIRESSFEFPLWDNPFEKLMQKAYETTSFTPIVKRKYTLEVIRGDFENLNREKEVIESFSRSLCK